MGQITNPIALGIAVNPIDRQSGPTAGGGATGNNSLFFGLNAGRNETANNVIVLGSNSGNGGITGPAGTIVLGVASLQALTTVSASVPASGTSLIVIGQ